MTETVEHKTLIINLAVRLTASDVALLHRSATVPVNIPEANSDVLAGNATDPCGDIMAERRQVERRKTTSGALVFSSRQRGIFSCALRDISDTGLGLRINDGDVIDASFKITLDNFSNVRTCQVIWSRGRYIGASFSTDLPGVQRL